MIVLGLLAGLVIFGMAGGGLTLLALAGRDRVNVLEAGALSWFFGTAAISLLLWTGGIFLSGTVLQTCVAAAALGLGILGFQKARRARVRLAVPRPRHAVEWLLASVIALQFAIMFYASFSYGLGWDGLLNWEIKARYAFFNDGVVPAAYFADASRDFTHQAYPLWIPLAELWLYLWMGEAHQFLIKILFPLFYVAGAILLITIATRLTGRRWIGLLAAALLFFVPCLTNTPGGVHVGYVDVPIGMLYLAAIGYLILSGNAGETAAWRIYALCLALLPWAKREGSVLWLVAMVCGLVAIWRDRRSKFALLWFLPGVAIMMGWKAFYQAMGKIAPHEFLPMTVATVLENLPRVAPICRLFLRETLELSRWSIFWPVLALAFFSLLFRARDRSLLILFVAITAPLSLYAATYLFSGWPDWQAHIEASLSRLYLQVMPVAWLVVALALQPPPARRISRAPVLPSTP